MMATAHPKLALRPFLPADTPLLAEIFRAAVAELTGEDYSEAQQEVWAAVGEDEAEFGPDLAGELTLIATLDGSPVGFASLEGKDKIGMLYVHPAVAGQGIGAMLAMRWKSSPARAAPPSSSSMPATPRAASSRSAAMSGSSATPFQSAANGSPTPPWKNSSQRKAS